VGAAKATAADNERTTMEAKERIVDEDEGRLAGGSGFLGGVMISLELKECLFYTFFRSTWHS
jgi:hypothetical protein